MSQNLRLFTKALYEFDAVVRRVPADAWDRASPCEGWTARQVAGHSIALARMIAAMARGDEPPPMRSEAEWAGDDPATSWSAALDDVLEALDHHGTLHRVASTPFGEMPVDRFLGIFAVDPHVHAWDLATAVGVDPALDTAISEKGLRQFERAGAAIRGPGMFAEPVDVPADADANTRFIAFSGRRP